MDVKERIGSTSAFLNERSSVPEQEIGVSQGTDLPLLPQESGETMVLENIPQMQTSLSEAKERILQLQEFIQTMMIPNVDFGMIPGCNKPCLFKPGAEKLADIYGFSKRIQIENRIEDFEKNFFHYEVKATLINKRTGMIECEGVGSCNTKEKKFARQDACSIVNSVLKMAKKRALIDAVLSATRTSGIFSQDMEKVG